MVGASAKGFNKNIQKMISKKHFQKDNFNSSAGNFSEPVNKASQVNDIPLLTDAKKEKDRTFHTISGFATLFLVGVIIGTALFDSKIARKSASPK